MPNPDHTHWRWGSADKIRSVPFCSDGKPVAILDAWWGPPEQEGSNDVSQGVSQGVSKEKQPCCGAGGAGGPKLKPDQGRLLLEQVVSVHSASMS